MASYTNEFKKKSQTNVANTNTSKMKDRDAYIGVLEEKVKAMSFPHNDYVLLCERLNEVIQQVTSLDGKVVHLTKLHRLGQSLIDSQEEEYNKDKHVIFQKLEKLEHSVDIVHKHLEKGGGIGKDSLQDVAFERLDNETKWIKKQLQSRFSSMSDTFNKEIRDLNDRERQSLQKMEELANVVQHEIRQRESADAELEKNVKNVSDITRKLADELSFQESRIAGKIKITDEKMRSEVAESTRAIQEDLATKYDELLAMMTNAERDKMSVQDQFQKLAAKISESHHALADAHTQLQRDVQEAIYEVRREKTNLEDELRTFREETRDMKREQQRLADEVGSLMTQAKGLLQQTQQQDEENVVSTRDTQEAFGKVDRELERMFEELDKLSLKQKVIDKALQKLNINQTTFGNFEQETLQKLGNFEQLQNKFMREITQKVEDGARETNTELAEAAKIEKRTALRVEECLEQVSGLSGQVQQFLKGQQSGASPSKFSQVEGKMKENIYRMYDDLRAKNEEFNQHSRELLKTFDTRIEECMHRINHLMDTNANARNDIQQKMEDCYKAVRSLQNEYKKRVALTKYDNAKPQAQDSTPHSKLNITTPSNKSYTIKIREPNTSFSQNNEKTNNNSNNDTTTTSYSININDDSTEKSSKPNWSINNNNKEGLAKEEPNTYKNGNGSDNTNSPTELNKSRSNEKATKLGQHSKSAEKENNNNEQQEVKTTTKLPSSLLEHFLPDNTHDKRVFNVKSVFDTKLADSDKKPRKTFSDFGTALAKEKLGEPTHRDNKLDINELSSMLQLPTTSPKTVGNTGQSPQAKRDFVPPHITNDETNTNHPKIRHILATPPTATKTKLGNSPRKPPSPRVSPRLSKLQTALQTAKKTVAAIPTKEKLAKPNEKLFEAKEKITEKADSIDKSKASKAKVDVSQSKANVTISSPTEERQTQRRLRDLYKELKALDYEDDEL